jgi:hypothetical protein
LSTADRRRGLLVRKHTLHTAVQAESETADTIASPRTTAKWNLSRCRGLDAWWSAGNQ